MGEFVVTVEEMNASQPTVLFECNRFSGGSVMVWGALNAGFRSDLIILNGTLTARRYIDGIHSPVLTSTSESELDFSTRQRSSPLC